MTDFATVRKRAAEDEPPLQDSLEARGSLAAKALAAINVAGMVLALIPGPLPISLLLGVAFNAAAGVLALAYVLVARGLDRRRTWAVSTIRPLLVVVLVASAYETVMALLGGRIKLPIAGVIALWALLGSRDPSLSGGPRLPAIATAALAGLLLASQLFVQPVFGWGGALDVPASAVSGTLEVDCGTAAEGAPDRLLLRYRWSWTASSPLPSGLDGVVLGWTGTDAEDRPLYLLDATPPTDRGIQEGKRDYPSADMVRDAASRFRGSWHWGIELSQRGFEPGEVTLELVRVREAPPGSRLVLGASYVHLGLWQRPAGEVVCAW